jgi:aryl-alcohol dehydrogenase-like predicted oxidoreductase
VRVSIPHTDLTVSPICLGGGHFGDPRVQDGCRGLMEAFLAAGGNFVDTAHVYDFWLEGGDGLSERTIGRVLREIGAKNVVVATKGGHPSVDGKYRQPDRYLSPEAIAGNIRDSFERLGFERIDLYYLHRDDTRVPVSEIIDALNALGDRVRHFGASNWSQPRLAAANAYAKKSGKRGFVASQPQWSLAAPLTWPEPNDDMAMRTFTPVDLAWHTESGVAVVPYSSTAHGYFSGRTGKTFDSPANQARRERATQLATELGVTPTQIALAYLRSHPFPVIPIIGSGNADHVREALGAANVTLTMQQAVWLRDGASQ